MELASASVCSAYLQYDHLPAAAADDAAAEDRGGGAGAQQETTTATTTTTTTTTRRRKRHGGGGCAGLRRRCYAVLKQQRTRLYILRRCVTMLLCWHEHDLSD